jgi:hypothetical protein
MGLKKALMVLCKVWGLTTLMAWSSSWNTVGAVDVECVHGTFSR